MLRNYAIACSIALLFCFSTTASAQDPTPNACATDAARRWETVMAYQSPTPSATPTPYADFSVDATLENYFPSEGDLISVDVEVKNAGNLASSFVWHVQKPQPRSEFYTETRELADGAEMLLSFWTTATEEGWVSVEVYPVADDADTLNNEKTIYYHSLTPTPSLFFEIYSDTVEVKKVVEYGDLMTVRVLDRFCFGTLFLLAAFFVVYYLRGRREYR